MKFCWCTLNVKDMESSLKFYTEIVGLDIERRMQAGPDIEIVFLGKGETKVELIANANNTNVEMGRDISLGFETESVDRLMETLKNKGVAILSGPHQPNPHVKFFYVSDPNGLKIQFVENM